MRATGFGAGTATGALLGGVSTLVLMAITPAFVDSTAAALALVVAHAATGALVGAVAAVFRPGASRGAAITATLGLYGIGVATLGPFYSSQAPGLATIAVAAVLGLALGLLLALPLRAVGPRPAAGLAIGIGALAVLAAAIRPAPGPVPARVIVVGLDGGTWRVLTPLLDRGELPAVERMRREGSAGVLQSMEPSPSAVLWTTIATGRTPAEHGIVDFYGTQNEALHAARFWEVASAAGERVGIFQWLITWPPDGLPGFIVPGWLARDARTHPSELRFLKEMELRLQQGEPIHLGDALHFGLRTVGAGLRFASAATIARDGFTAWRLGSSRATYRAGKYAQLAINGDVFLALHRATRPGVGAIVLYGSDALSHQYWQYHEPRAFTGVRAADVAAYGDTIDEYYRRFDAFLGRLLDTVGRETTVVLVSDHGFHAAGKRNLTISTAALLRAIGAGDRFRAHAINLQVYVTHRAPDSPGAAAETAAMVARLRALHAGGTELLDVSPQGTQVEVTLRSGVDAQARDLELAGAAAPTKLGDLVTLTTWSGSHEPEGIILARGPGIRAGHRIERATVLDVAPTVLAALGQPVSQQMDGRVLAELFTTPPAVHQVATVDGAMPARAREATADVSVEGRLRALGYVR